MKDKAFNRFLAFLNDLDRGNLSYTLGHHREEAVMVLIAVPEERWEVEFFADGSVEVERFASSGDIQGAEALAELFTRYCDKNDPVPAAPQAVELATVPSA